jgi:CTP:molybdopterin cytidylyltransferase MocA
MTFTALVMAASRRGPTDPLAVAAGVSHKALTPVAGIPMITRVVQTLRASREIGRIYVSIEKPDLIPPGLDVTWVPSQATLADSVLSAVAAMGEPWPLVITTADNALHTPEMIDVFCRETAAADADVTLGITPASVILAKYPDGVRAFHRFRDGEASGCNIYAMKTRKGLAAAQAFAGGGQFGKKKYRILFAFGVFAFVLHMLRLLTLDQAMGRIGKAFGLKCRAVRLMYAEAPIDVDNPRDLAMTEKILAQRT